MREIVSGPPPGCAGACFGACEAEATVRMAADVCMFVQRRSIFRVASAATRLVPSFGR
jgi:hypothetical protein